MKINEDDISFIGGDFLISDLPLDKVWLYRYFNSGINKRFLVYWVTFRNLINRVSLRCYCQLFIDHTGYYCAVQALCHIAKKIRMLETEANEAEKLRDFTRLANIKLGNYEIK